MAKAAGELLRFGLVGCGARGHSILTHFNRIPSGRCVAVCDLRDERLRSAQGISNHRPQAHSDYRELLDRKDVDAVAVATPLREHFPVTRDALKAGKHVFCERPLVFRPEEVVALRGLAESHSDQVIQVGFQRRYSEFYQLARKMASKGYLGEVTHISIQSHVNAGEILRDASRADNWRYFREYSLGLLSEFTAAQLDVAEWVFGDAPETVIGVGGLNWSRDGRDVDDNLALVFRYPGGRKLTATAVATNPHLPMLGGTRTGYAEMIMGTEGTIEITVGDDDLPALGLWYYQPSPTKVSTPEARQEIARVAGATMGAGRRDLSCMPILLKDDQFTGDESFFERELKYSRRWLYANGLMAPREDRHPVEVQLEDFLECCRSGRKPKADVEAGLSNATTMILADHAMRQGRKVNFDEFEKLSHALKSS